MSTTGPIEVRRTESATGWSELFLGRPTGQLASLVGRYCGYRERNQATVERREPAGSSIPVILSFGDTIRVDMGEHHGARLQSFVAGLHPGAATTRYQGGQFGVQMDLSPLGAYRIFGLPGSELAGHVVDLGDVAPELGSASLQDQLASLPGWEARFDLVDRVLRRLAADGPEPEPMVRWVWHQLQTAGGQVRIADLVEETGRSHRHVTARFRSQVGLTPKAAANVIRFEHAAREVTAGSSGLADVAARHGYADQSHLTREFVRMAGSPPSRFAASDAGPDHHPVDHR